jgi:hypothetical protein
LGLLLDIIRSQPSSIATAADRYYKLMATYCDQVSEDGKSALSSVDQQGLIKALSVPLAEQDSPGMTIICSQF